MPWPRRCHHRPDCPCPRRGKRRPAWKPAWSITSPNRSIPIRCSTHDSQAHRPPRLNPRHDLAPALPECQLAPHRNQARSRCADAARRIGGCRMAARWPENEPSHPGSGRPRQQWRRCLRDGPLLREQFFEICLVFAGEVSRLPPDAAAACQDFIAGGGTVSPAFRKTSTGP